MKVLKPLVLVFGLFAISPRPLAASQATQSVALHGSVLDATRAPIMAAQVAAVPADGQGPAVSSATDGQGEFTLTLATGRYTVTVTAEGFLPVERVIITTRTGSQEFVLQVAGFRDTITVTALPTYRTGAISSGTKTLTPLRDIPQSITIITRELMKDQLMVNLADVVRYVPGITTHQGENNRDQVIIRGNNSSADFFVNGVRDDVQYYRDLYNLDRVEALKGPNAMIFGRGGAGGVVNRVTKEAGFMPLHEIALQAGEYGHKRVATDFDQPISDKVALRLNAMFERSDSFRHDVNLERYGLSPTLTITPGTRTKIVAGYEFLHDMRVADRGVTSFQGRPADVDIATYYGNPDDSHVRARVNLGSITVEQQVGNVLVRNHTLVGGYDRGYQNFVPGAATADKSLVALTAYNNATNRLNVFNQTDVTYATTTGHVRHTLLAGVELGRQLTDNFRNTGFFNDTATSISVPYANPAITTPVTFRQNATDADNHLVANLAAVYAQDQIELSRVLQVIGGLRFDRFDLQYHNDRNGDALGRVDNLVSPRAGIVIKPIAPLSLYTTYSVSYLPSSGDQFSSLTAVTRQVQPERFNNYEVGLKWDVVPALALTTAVYRLDRTNTRSTDPNDATRIVQTGSQRTNGFELGVNGRISPLWRIAGGYASQDAFVTSATTAAIAGASVGQVPHHTLSLWNHYQVHPRVAAGLGVIHRSDMFAAIDDTVTLPGYTRIDAAAYFALTRTQRIQINIENLFDKPYYTNADSNTNVSPGSPRAMRIGWTTTF